MKIVPQGVSSLEVYSVFRVFGEIRGCRVHIDTNHRSLETALVIYEEPKSAVKAIAERGGEELMQAHAYQSK